MKQVIFRVFDIVAIPFVFLAAWLLRLVRRIGVQKLPFSKRVMIGVGVFPVRDHYYEPQFDFRTSRPDFSRERALPGIDWNVDGQLALLAELRFGSEIDNLPTKPGGPLDFYLGNNQFGSGDAEYWYQLVRAVKPKRIIEIGSGNSTLMAIRAIRRNVADDPRYSCAHTCIEPYEMPWLETSGVKVVRQKVEDMDVSFFAALQDGDILFIDSSHMIRPHGDVLHEYLELLPTLNKGVIVHVHDIFSPKNYPEDWVVDDVRFWNEQYLLEAFLSQNHCWRIVGALNFLHSHHYERLKAVAPSLQRESRPGSFYIRAQ
jgi:hypothetical protein